MTGALALGPLAAGCGTTGTFEAGEFRGEDTSFRVGELDGNWSRVGVRDQNDLAFVHGPTSALIQANASCAPNLDIPLEALRNHLLIGFTEREVLDERRVQLDGREALDVHVRAKLDGVPRELRLTILKKNDCVYDMALVAAPDVFREIEPQYDAFLAGFHTDGREPPQAYR